MSFDTTTYRLSDAINIIGGGTPKRSNPDFWGGAIPWLSVVDFNSDARFVENTVEKITQEGLDRSSSKLLEKGQLIISARGTVGCLAQLTKPMAFNQSCYGLDGKEGIIENDFLYYLVKLKVAELKQKTHGAVFDTITRETFNHIDVDIPNDPNVRSKISKILGDLDKKIAINNKANQTLEQIAQAIFKSWFVDFEPVRAKMAVLEAGGTAEQAELAAMSAISAKDEAALKQLQAEQPDAYAELAQTAALFPSAMEESELGEIPEGWDVTNFGSVSECFDRKRIPLSKRQREKRQGNVPYYGATSIMDYVDEAIFDDIYLLLGEDGSVLKENGNPFVQYIWGPSWVNNHAHVLQGRNGISTEHLMIFISTQNIAAYVTGAVQLKLNQKNMNSIPFIKAADAINTEYQSLIAPLYENIRTVSEQSLSLVELRDSLLPRLLSGELPISEDML